MGNVLAQAEDEEDRVAAGAALKRLPLTTMISKKRLDQLLQEPLLLQQKLMH